MFIFSAKTTAVYISKHMPAYTSRFKAHEENGTLKFHFKTKRQLLFVTEADGSSTQKWTFVPSTGNYRKQCTMLWCRTLCDVKLGYVWSRCGGVTCKSYDPLTTSSITNNFL
jgi:hypothetical protein